MLLPILAPLVAKVLAIFMFALEIVPTRVPIFLKIATASVVIIAASFCAQAHPYASGVTNDNGTIRFTLNESGGTVYIVFEDNTTNNLGVLNKGARSFALGAHTSFSIYVHKDGNGTPALIESTLSGY